MSDDSQTTPRQILREILSRNDRRGAYHPDAVQHYKNIVRNLRDDVMEARRVLEQWAESEITPTAHTDHPLRHFDRTCPACVEEQNAATPTAQLGDKTGEPLQIEDDWGQPAVAAPSAGTPTTIGCHHGWRGSPIDHAIVTPCPACGAKSLFIGEGGHLTCARVPNDFNNGCDSPSVEETVNTLKRALAEEKMRHTIELEDHRSTIDILDSERKAFNEQIDRLKRELAEAKAAQSASVPIVSLAGYPARLHGSSGTTGSIGPFGLLIFADPTLPDDVMEFRDAIDGRVLAKIINVGKA